MQKSSPITTSHTDRRPASGLRFGIFGATPVPAIPPTTPPIAIRSSSGPAYPAVPEPNRCTPLPTSAIANPNARSVPTTLAAGKSVIPSRETVPSAPAPEDENPTSAPIGTSAHPATSSDPCPASRNPRWPEKANQLPARGEQNDRPQHERKQRLGPCAATCRKKSEPATTPGKPPSSIHASTRQLTCRRATWNGTTISLTIAEYASAVLTATSIGTPRTGSVMAP